MTFTVYSKKGCPYCDKIKVVLSDLSVKKGCPVTCYELGTDFTREEFYAEFGEGSTFPQVIMGEQHLGGCSDTVRYLSENSLL
jgi:glutaredoxin 3